METIMTVVVCIVSAIASLIVVAIGLIDFYLAPMEEKKKTSFEKQMESPNWLIQHYEEAIKYAEKHREKYSQTYIDTLKNDYKEYMEYRKEKEAERSCV